MKTGILRKIIKTIYIILGLIPLLLLALMTLFAVLYIIKSLLGIDIFPGGHFWEFL